MQHNRWNHEIIEFWKGTFNLLGGGEEGENWKMRQGAL